MSINTEVELYCDGVNGFSCTTIPIFARTAVAARLEAREAGWRTNLSGGKDLCPRHREEEHQQ